MKTIVFKINWKTLVANILKCSKKEAQTLIEQGSVKLNGEVIKDFLEKPRIEEKSVLRLNKRVSVRVMAPKYINENLRKHMTEKEVIKKIKAGSWINDYTI